MAAAQPGNDLRIAPFERVEVAPEGGQDHDIAGGEGTVDGDAVAAEAAYRLAVGAEDAGAEGRLETGPCCLPWRRLAMWKKSLACIRVEAKTPSMATMPTCFSTGAD